VPIYVWVQIKWGNIPCASQRTKGGELKLQNFRPFATSLNPERFVRASELYDRINITTKQIKVLCASVADRVLRTFNPPQPSTGDFTLGIVPTPISQNQPNPVYKNKRPTINSVSKAQHCYNAGAKNRELKYAALVTTAQKYGGHLYEVVGWIDPTPAMSTLNVAYTARDMIKNFDIRRELFSLTKINSKPNKSAPEEYLGAHLLNELRTQGTENGIRLTSSSLGLGIWVGSTVVGGISFGVGAIGGMLIGGALGSATSKGIEFSLTQAAIRCFGHRQQLDLTSKASKELETIIKTLQESSQELNTSKNKDNSQDHKLFDTTKQLSKLIAVIGKYNVTTDTLLIDDKLRNASLAILSSTSSDALLAGVNSLLEIDALHEKLVSILKLRDGNKNNTQH